MNTGGIQDVGTIGSWTPSRLTRYIQNEMSLRQRDAKTSLSADELFAHNNLTFSSGDFQTADTKVTRPRTGVLAINNVPIVMSANPVTSVFGRTGIVVATSGDYTAAQVTNAADKASSSNQEFVAPVGSTAGLAGGAYLQGTSTYVAANGFISGVVGSGIYFDGTNWQNKTFGGNNGWAAIAVRGASTPGGIDLYGVNATGASDRAYTPAQFLAQNFGSWTTDGTLTTLGRVFSGTPGSGGMWVDGGTSTQFMGSFSASQMGWYYGGWWLLINNAGDLRLQGTYGHPTGLGVGGVASAASTSVTLNKISGQVSFTGQANTANVPKAFVVTNSFAGANDVILVSMNTATGAAGTFVTSAFANAGSFTITAISNTANASATFSFNFWIFKSTNN